MESLNWFKAYKLSEVEDHTVLQKYCNQPI